LFSYTLDEDATVADFGNSPDLITSFALPLSVQAFEELTSVRAITQDLTSDHADLDRRVFTWGNQDYTSAKYYKFVFEALPEDAALSAISKSKCLPKLKVFAWLLLMDRLNTKDLMLRKNWHVEGGSSCVLCSANALETRDRLLFQSPFADAWWDLIGIQWNCSFQISSCFIQAQILFRGPCFIVVVVSAAWNIWKERNNFIFRNETPSLARWKVRFKSDLSLHQYRVKATLVQPLLDWILTFSS
jgi:hypothetical protein